MITFIIALLVLIGGYFLYGSYESICLVLIKIKKHRL